MIEPILTGTDQREIIKLLESSGYKEGCYFVTDNKTHLTFCKINSNLKIETMWQVNSYLTPGLHLNRSYIWLLQDGYAFSSSEFLEILRKDYPEHLDWIIFNQFWLKLILLTHIR